MPKPKTGKLVFCRLKSLAYMIYKLLTDKVTTHSLSHDSFKRYEHVDELGRGAFGTVYKVLDKETNIQ